MRTSHVELDKTWFLEGEREVALLSEEPSLAWIHAYRELAIRGVGMVVWNATGEKRDFSLEFLSEVVDVIPALKIATVDRVSNLEALEGAPRLRNLSINAGGRVRADLSTLMALADYQGQLNRHLMSVLDCRNLRFLEVVGRLPSLLPRVAGPVERYTQIGAGTVEIFEFDQPDAVQVIQRAGASTFDLERLGQFRNLRGFRLDRCADVRNINSLNSHQTLEDAAFFRCVTADSWELLDFDGGVMLMDVKPTVSQVFATQARRRGWVVS